MTSLPKRRRVRLEPEPYSHLRDEILRRDDWRCQRCGGRYKLQVHHVNKRSHNGDDSESNLITLCEACHRYIHQGHVVRSDA